MSLSLTSFGMCMVLRDSFSDSQIAKLVNTCGIFYPGARTKSIPVEKLVNDLVEYFKDNFESRKIILKALKKANEKTVEEFRGYSPKEITLRTRDLDPLIQEEKLGAVVYALATDNRLQVQRIADRIVHSVEDKATSVLEGLEEMGETIPEGDYVEDLEEEINDLEKENKRLIRQEENFKKNIGTLKASLEEKKNQLVSLRKDLSQKSETLRKVQSEVRALSKEKEKLELRIKKTEEKPDETSIIQTTHQFIRETKKLHHKVENVLENIQQEEKERESLHLKALGHQVERIQKAYDTDKFARDKKIQQLSQTVKEVAKKVDFLYASERGALVEREKKNKKDKGPLRVGVFVDVQNLYYAAKRLGAKIDFEKLLSATVGQRRLVRAIAYVILTPEIDQSGFISMLQQKSYEVRRKELRVRSDGSAKGDWDMGMAVDIMELVDKLDVVVIVSGDGDFVSLVHLIKTKGPRVEVFSIPQNTSKDLIEVADEYFPITEGMLLG